jgi:hypothetical protein
MMIFDIEEMIKARKNVFTIFISQSFVLVNLEKRRVLSSLLPHFDANKVCYIKFHNFSY